MTANKNFKRRVRARARKTGESYTAALRHFQSVPSGDFMPDTDTIRIAVAQLDTPSDPSAAAALHRAGHDIRRLMSRAREQGARLIHFCEGAICAPNKRIMSSNPDTVADADWTRFGWEAQRAELRSIAEHAASLQLWTVVGAVHRLSAPHRPHNSLYVIDNHGRVVTRYDERMLSNTKVSYMYTPGTSPITFDVDGVRFGCALGMESVYPELFLDYERADVHCVLLDTGPRRIVRAAGTRPRQQQQLLDQLCHLRRGRSPRTVRHRRPGRSLVGTLRGDRRRRGRHRRHRP